MHLHCSFCAYSACSSRRAAFHRRALSCEGFVKEWFDRQSTNTSSFYMYQQGFSQGQTRHTVLKRSGYSRKVNSSKYTAVRFVSLAACQWRRGGSRPHPGGRGVRQIEAITESSQQCGWAQDLHGIMPISTNDALSTARLEICEGRQGELQEV